MKDSQRVLLNTVAQYTRTIINMILSLYTVRVVLSSLGQSDYGIYSLIAGIVAMLGFITNSLVGTTQRFISYYQGVGDKKKLKEVMNDSIVIHLAIGIIFVIIFESITPFLFDGFLNIPEGREQAATIIYQIVVVILFITFLNAPFHALLVSHENIVFISIVEIINGVLKLFLVLVMAHSSVDKLVFYGFIMLGVQMFAFIALSVYDYLKYDECVWPKFSRIHKGYVKELISFAGWRIYGTACLVGRDQGISIVLNRTFGTVMNAGWGIGAQISGYTNFLSSAIVNAMSPQIVKAEGRGNRQHSIWLSNVLSKLVFFLMSIIGIPMVFEIDSILTIWLGTPPDNAGLFSIMFIVALLFDSLTIGLKHINNAIGNIGKYIRIMNTPKLFTFALVFLLIKLNAPLWITCLVYCAIEAICAFIRIPLVSEQSGLNVKLFFRDVILMEIIPVAICVATCLLCVHLFSFQYRFVLTFGVSAFIYAISMFFLGLTKQERTIVLGLIKDVLIKLKITK